MACGGVADLVAAVEASGVEPLLLAHVAAADGFVDESGLGECGHRAGDGIGADPFSCVAGGAVSDSPV